MSSIDAPGLELCGYGRKSVQDGTKDTDFAAWMAIAESRRMHDSISRNRLLSGLNLSSLVRQDGKVCSIWRLLCEQRKKKAI
jgi:hypothetical protein